MRKLFFLMLLIVSFNVSATSVPAIKNNDPKLTQSITKLEAYWLYTLKLRYWDSGHKVTLFLLPFDSSVHNTFVRDTLGINPRVFQQVIESNINIGVGSYRFVRSEYLMYDMVSKVPGAIGYVSNKLLINEGEGHVRKINITD
jgi:hypothetical protein